MEKIDYSLPTEGIKLKATTPSISEISERERERSIEKLKQGVEASSQSRSKVVSVFERAGKPLSLSLDTKPSKSLPISIESGVEKVSYDPKWNNADTGGVIPAFTYGDRQVRDAQGEVWDAQDRVDRNWRQVILANQQYIDAQNAYNQAQIDSNNFYNNPENRAALTPGWDALDNWQAQWTYNRNNWWILVATPNSPISQSTLDRFNTVSQSGDQLNYRVDQTYRNQISAQDRQQYIIDGLQENQRYLDYTRNILSTEERNRYRYIAWGIDFDKKVLESMKIFTELYGKKYSKDEIINQYITHSMLSDDSWHVYKNEVSSQKQIIKKKLVSLVPPSRKKKKWYSLDLSVPISIVSPTIRIWQDLVISVLWNHLRVCRLSLVHLHLENKSQHEYADRSI